MTLLLALVWILVSPIWLYCLVSIKDTVMENRSYIALLGIAALAAWAAERAPIPVLLLVILYSIRTIQRNRAWRSPMSFAATAFAESPKNGRAQLNYATALQASGANVLAVEHYTKLIKAGVPQGGQACANLASLRIMEGRVKETLLFLPHAIATWPGTADLHINYGAALAMNKQTKEAAFQFGLALMLQPAHPSALRNRAQCLYVLGQEEQAREDAEKAERLDGRPLTFR